MRTADPSADGRRSAAIFATVELPSAGGGAYRLAAPAEVGETLLASRCSELYLYLVVCGFLLDKITRDFCTALELHLLLHQLLLPFFFFLSFV